LQWIHVYSLQKMKNLDRSLSFLNYLDDRWSLHTFCCFTDASDDSGCFWEEEGDIYTWAG